MTGHKDILQSFKSGAGGDISFGDKTTGSITGSGGVKLNEKIEVSIVNLVDFMKYNLLSVAQLCDQGTNKVVFTTTSCYVKNPKKEIILKGRRYNSTYIFDSHYVPKDYLCLAAIDDHSALWHNRLGHASLHLLSKLHTKGLVRGLPPIKPSNQSNCAECMKGKQVHSSFKVKNDVTSKAPLELLHMDICGPMRVQSPGGARYMFVIVDDYSRFTWTLFLRSKDEVHSRFTELTTTILT